MALASGTKLGPYEIQSPLGAGGMGEVYRATDTKLGRDVALKVLPAEMAQDPERLGRFRREAKTLAQLDHPNIVTIHSVEEYGGIHFLTMQLVEGLPLDRLIPQCGLPVEQIFEIATALGDALAAAHEKGIVHRDLKPANVMVSNDGRVKVLDFGLAKDIRAANLSDATMTSDSRTQVGVVMGTPAYMSPEQTSGRSLDHRTDIFSLGVLLYEMATGQRPFNGSSSAELVSAILRDNPPSVTETRPDLPSDLARIVRRCLEKDPRHRVQTARDVSNEFRDLSRHTSQKLTSTKTPTIRAVASADSGSARADEGFWVAVLPFKYIGGNTELTGLAEGLTEDIVTGLSRFSYLRVIARSSTTRYAGGSGDVRSAGKELGARYVMEGSIRQSGTKVRIAVQLVDANAGSSLWAETYDRSFTREDALDVLDDVVPRIVATVGDAQGILAHSMTEALRHRDPESLTPYEALLRSFGFHQHVSEGEHLAGITALESAVKKAPDHADCWAMLSWLYRAEYTHGYHAQPDSMARSLTAARRAVNLAPSSQLAHAALASAHFFCGEPDEFRAAAERALALNRMQGYTTAFLGLHFAYSGDWERGCALAERATELNPNHPGWYWLPLVINAYRQNNGERALQHALKINMPGLWTAQVALTVVNAQLGRMDQARSALRSLLAARPDFATRAQEDLLIWWQPEMVEQMLGDLRKAGFTASTAAVPARDNISQFPAKADSAGARADEGFWVAVLPFKYSGGNADLTALAEGLTEDIVTGLSRFSYLRVIARSSASRYAGQSVDVRVAGKELNARYVMEGTLRQAGSKLRLAVQLVDSTTGAHLWAENYERAARPEAMFELQDDLVPRIVSTVADMNGALPRSMSAAVRGRDPHQLSPYEAVLRAFGYFERLNPDELAAARSGLEEALRKAPVYADAWALLGLLCVHDYAQGFDLRADALSAAASAAQRAVETGPSNHLAYFALAQTSFFLKEYHAFRAAAEQAMALNPMDGNCVASLGGMLVGAGDFERGMELSGRAKQLNPNHPGWYWFANFHHAYGNGDYRGALGFVLKANLPRHWSTPWMMAVCHAQLGETEEAAKALRKALEMRPSFARTVRQDIEKWYNPELTEHVLEGLRKAGMEVPAAGAAAGQKISSASRAGEGFWVAVLPFKAASGDMELEALADGLTEDITAGLSRFPYLQVIAHNSAMAYKGRTGDIRTLGHELGARYVIEGSIRKRGRAIRVSAQLLDAATGTQLWAETYDREIGDREARDADTFQIQDDLTDHIVTSVADGYGVLVRSMAAPTRGRKVEELSASELVLRHYAFMQQVNPQEHAVLRTGFERALEREPNHATAWACLSNLYQLEYFDRFNPREKPLERASEAAWRAVEIDPASQMGWKELAGVQFFCRDFTAFRETAERAMSLNPREGTTLAFMALMIAFSGDWERGMALTQRAIELNRHHPGWYHNVAFHHHYRKGEYEAALQAAKRINMPEFHWMHLMTAASCGMLGRHEEARKAIESLRKYNPTFCDLENVRQDVELWDPDKDEVEQLLQGLQKAGLKYGSENSAATADSTAIKIEPELKSDSTAAATSASIATAPASGASGAAVREDEGFWVAVLPFKYAGNHADLASLADALADEIITGLSKFSYLRVISRSSSSRYAGQSVDVRSAGKELNARYVMEGTLRQAGGKLRLTVQLVDAASGAHLWAENYERAFSPEAVFELQDDLVPRIVSTVADMNGMLPRSMSEAVRSRDPEKLSPYEAVLRSFGYFERYTAEELSAARSGLETAVRKSPAYADAWAMLSYLCAQDYVQGYELQANALESAATAARRAVQLSPSNHLALFSLAQALSYQRDFDSFRDAAERAAALNPMDGNSVALLGELLTYAGDAERGMQLAGRAKQLNPNHPGSYWFADFYHAYSQGDYRGALAFGLKAKLGGNPLAPMFIATACGQLGDVNNGAKAVAELLKFRPELPALMRKQVAKIWNPEYGERFVDGLRKAGMQIPEEGAGANQRTLTQTTTSASRAAVREDEGFWVAVLPFKYAGAITEAKGLAEGLSDEIITGLSRFSYLHVIARGSTAKYSSESGDVRAIGRELGARYVMEGTLRHAGSKLRLAVQLADADSGGHLWAETYEHSFTPETVFEVQDNLVPRIVSTVADQYGVLPRSMSDVLRKKSADALTPHEAVLRAFSYFTRITAEEHAEVRSILERAVREAPDHADSWAMLSMLYRGEFAQGYNAGPNPLDRALAAAQHAVDIAPTHALGHYTLATVYFFRKEMIPFQVEAERALTLNPLDAGARAYLGLLTATSGDWERGCQMVESALRLNPNCPGYFYFAGACNAYRQSKYEEVLEAAARINMPNYYQVPAMRAAALGQLGRLEEAQQAVRALLALRPDFGATVRQEYGKWYGPELVEHLLDGLRKAGLEIADSQADGQAPALARFTSTSAHSTDSKTPSIAVLPFANMSADKDQEYFSDGLAEEIINLLAKIPGLKVIARTSAFAFRGKEQDIRGIADALGVTHVLEGSVRRADNRLRITGQLIDATDGTHLWSERYDRELSDIFSVQDEISTAISRALRVKFSGEALPQRYEPKLAAYESYLKGKYHQATVTPESLDLAKRCFEQAIELDPAFGLARIGVGFYWLAMTIFGRCPARQAVLAARTEAERALRIDPALPDAHALLGYSAAIYDLDWLVAERHFEFPLAKQVGTTTTRPLYGWFQYLRGNVAEAITLAERAIEEDPLDLWSRMNLHAYLQAAGRERDALEQLKKVLELDGNQVVAMVSMAMILADQGNLEEALVIARRAHSIGPWLPETAGVLAGLLRRSGEETQSQSIAKTIGSGGLLGDARSQALFHLLSGELNEGADWAEKAIAEEDMSMRMVYLRFVACKDLRASHRWPKIAQMINLPQPS